MTTVQMIHNEIDTAQDRLLSEARAIIVKFNDTSGYASRLANAGFINSEIVLKSNPVVVSKEAADLIEYYLQAYPFQKFLTESEFDRICDKYNLVYAPVSAYSKNVPEKNLIEIENVSHLNRTDRQEDLMKFRYTSWIVGPGTGLTFSERQEIKRGIIVPHRVVVRNSAVIGEYFRKEVNMAYEMINNETVRISRDGLFIAAPKSHFNFKGLAAIGKGFFNFKVEPKDPIVFRYVRGGIQVITKWGDEASDKDLVNQIDN